MRSFVLVLFLGMSSVAMAHPGGGDHHHVQAAAISESSARSKAATVVKSKVDQGRLPEKWLKVKASKSYKKSFGHGDEWVVEFHDPKASDESKRALYVFLGLTGKVLGINFTGQ